MIYFIGLYHIIVKIFRFHKFAFSSGLRAVPILFLTFSGLMCSVLSAAPVDQSGAYKITSSWLIRDAQIMGRRLGEQIDYIKTFTDDHQQPVYHVVYLYPRGYVIVSAEDGVEPIIGFVSEGRYNPSQSNPLGALVSGDLPVRVRAARTIQRKNDSGQSEEKLNPYDIAVRKARKKAIEKRKMLLAAGDAATGLKMSLGSISDVRVSPLVQSKWGQETVSGNACYNYYTPPYGNGNADNYPCGCVANSMAQYMRFRQYPTTGAGTGCFTIYIDESPNTRCLRGGNGAGGPYNWGLMTLVPNSSTTLAQRQAIGALTYDAGVAIGTHYASDGSGGYMSKVDDALINTFGYSSAILGYNSNNNIGSALIAMVNPNLDSGNPVILSVEGDGGHSIITDGYGYSGLTLYHHLNMGWDGSEDVWYNLPNIDSSPSFDVIDGAIYNIYTSGTGEIISGRVMDEDAPLANVIITATKSGGITYQAQTNAKGIYAITNLPSNSSYNVRAYKSGYSFENLAAATGLSKQTVSGNKWGVDFSNVGSRIRISRCTVTAGKTDNSDSISFSGTINASTDDILAADDIVISVDSGQLPAPMIRTFPINVNTFKNGSYSCTLIETGTQTVFRFKPANGTFSFSAKYADLTGLSCPITVSIQIGVYQVQTMLDEPVVNGTVRSCPLLLLMGVEDSFSASKFKAVFRTNPNTDSFTAQGTFTLAGNYDKLNPLVIILGEQSFTVPGNLFINKNNVESCRKAISNEGPLVDIRLDFIKCTYTMTIKNTSISQRGIVDFGINCFGINLENLETVNITN